MIDPRNSGTKVLLGQRLQLLAFEHDPGHGQGAGEGEAAVVGQAGAADAYHVGQGASGNRSIVFKRGVADGAVRCALQNVQTTLRFVGQAPELPFADEGHGMLYGERLPWIPLGWQPAPRLPPDQPGGDGRQHCPAQQTQDGPHERPSRPVCWLTANDRQKYAAYRCRCAEQQKPHGAVSESTGKGFGNLIAESLGGLPAEIQHDQSHHQQHDAQNLVPTHDVFLLLSTDTPSLVGLTGAVEKSAVYRGRVTREEGFLLW